MVKKKLTKGKEKKKRKINRKIAKKIRKMERERMKEIKKKHKEIRKIDRAEMKREKKKKKEKRRTEKIKKKVGKRLKKLEKKMKRIDNLKQGKINVIESMAAKRLAEKKKLKGKKRKWPIITILGIFYAVLVVFFLYINLVMISVLLLVVLVLIVGYSVLKKRMKRFADIKKMETVFPDFISLMSSNLRAGMTIDKAMLLSARKEFAPLDKEITNLGKSIVTGMEVNKALLEMAERTGSEEIRKTVLLIISGIRSGGNLSVLLEQVSANMRERNFIRMRASSNVLMYVIFIFFAVAFGAPILFGLSSVLVEVLTQIVANIPVDDVSNLNVPFVLTKVNVSVGFILYFSLAFIIVTDILASLVLGLVKSGKERDGLKYIPILMVLSVSMFFISRFVISLYLPEFV
jgi:archaeal flagellar protein FlaJ